MYKFQNIKHLYIIKESTVKIFREYKLKNCIQTFWGDYRISLAQNLMMKEGIKDCSHFIFLSDSCIPLKNFDYIYDYLDNHYSYFNKAPDHQSFPRCNDALNFVDKKYIKKANTNSIIDNDHENIIINSEHLIRKWFSRISNADENCHISILYYILIEKMK